MAALSWLLATHNRGKLRELRRILDPFGVEVKSLSDFGVTEVAEETGTTFEQNAMLKAEFYFRRTHIPVLADDSGLEVDALGGEPGVYSARFGGFETHAEKIAFLLGRLYGRPAEERAARFRCVAAFFDGERRITADGAVEGLIGAMPIGENGFGYDPVFYLHPEGPSMAQVSAEEKDAMSHRGKAFRKLLQRLPEISRRASST